MIKRLQELSRCTSLNPSLCCVKWTGSGGGNTARRGQENETLGVDGTTWVVCSSGDAILSLNPSAPSEQNRSVKVKFGANCSSAFLLSSSPEVDHSPKVVVCLSNGEVHLLSVRKCLEAQMKGKGKQRLKRSASVNSMDLSAKRFKKGSKSPNDIFISLLDSDGDDSGSGSDGGDIAKDESDVRNSDKNDGHGIDAQHMVSTTPAGEITDLVSSEDVSSLWFVREHWQHQIVLAGHQLGTDTLLLQVGEPPGNESVKLEYYKWEADQDGEESVQLVSRFPLPIQVAGVCEEPGFVPATLPLPLLIVGHQSGSQIGRLVPSHTISSSFYRQLFGPELALVKVPILLLGAPSGEVLYTPVTNMFAAGGGGGRSCNIFSGPLCCLSQVVKGIHPVSSHRTDICDGLVVIGGRGKVLICIEDRDDEKGTLSPKIESLHVGFTVLSSCLLLPCLLVISGMKYVKIVDLTPALVSLGGRDRSVVLQCLHKTFYRASRLEAGEIIRIESANHTTPEDRSCVSFDFDGGLSVIDISDKQLGENQLYAPATSSAMTVKERIAAKMAKLRRLESDGENATERLHKVEGYIRDVNMALHTVHLLTTGKETAFKVEQVTVLETGQSGSCCLKVSLAYGGQLKLGAGWSLVLSATAEGTRHLHVIQLPVMHHSACSDGSHGDGAACSSVSSLEGMSPGSLCHCYLTIPVRDAIQPLVLTCTLRYDTTEASQYLGREQRADVSGVLLKKSLSVLDFMQPVPANVHISSSQPTKSHTTGPKPSSASGNETEARAISISRETVYKCVSSTGNHDSKTLLHHFMHVLIGRHNSNVPLESVGKDDVWLRLVLPDGSVVLLSAKCALGKRQDSIECVCKSPSYNVLMAGTDAVIDRIGCVLRNDTSSSSSHDSLPQPSTTTATRDLLSEVSRCTRLLKEMKQKGPLEQDLIAKVKALNEEVISFKSRAL